MTSEDTRGRYLPVAVRLWYPPELPEYAEPRAWFSPTGGYHVLHYAPRGPLGVAPVIVRTCDGEPVTGLPEDAYTLGYAPTRHAYDVVCASLAEHRQRADDLQGRFDEMVKRVLPHIGGDWTTGPPPLEVAVDVLIHLVRMGGSKDE
jgi:hypothetical protein